MSRGAGIHARAQHHDGPGRHDLDPDRGHDPGQQSRPRRGRLTHAVRARHRRLRRLPHLRRVRRPARQRDRARLTHQPRSLRRPARPPVAGPRPDRRRQRGRPLRLVRLARRAGLVGRRRGHRRQLGRLVGHGREPAESRRHRLARAGGRVGPGRVLDHRVLLRTHLRLGARRPLLGRHRRPGRLRHAGAVRRRARRRPRLRGHRLRLRRQGLQPRRRPGLRLDLRLRGRLAVDERGGRQAAGEARRGGRAHRTGHRRVRTPHGRPARPGVPLARRPVGPGRQARPRLARRRRASRRTRCGDDRVPLAPSREPVRRRGLVRRRHRDRGQAAGDAARRPADPAAGRAAAATGSRKSSPEQQPSETSAP